MKISIVIPIFKVEEYIERCIRSVVEQSYSDIELVLVDDKSPDNSIQIAQQILNECKFPENRIKYVTHLQNKGLSGARNSGIAASTGKLIYFLDSDDAISPDCIGRLAEVLIKNNADYAVGNVETIRDNKSYTSHQYACDSILENGQILKKLIEGKIPVMAWNKLLRRSFVIQNELYFKEGLTHEDELWTFMVVIASKKAVTIKEATYHYYIREGSITSDREINKLDNAIKIFGEMVDYVKYKAVSCPDIDLYLNRFAYWRFYSIIMIKGLSLSQRYNYYKLLVDNHKQYVSLGNSGIINAHLLFPSILGFGGLLVMVYGYKLKVIIKQLKSFI